MPLEFSALDYIVQKANHTKQEATELLHYASRPYEIRYRQNRRYEKAQRKFVKSSKCESMVTG